MALTIRLQCGGSKKNPHYRMVVAERASRRDGRYVELLGHYSPRDTDTKRYLDLDMARVEHWLKVGALPTDSARTLITRARKAAPAAKA